MAAQPDASGCHMGDFYESDVLGGAGEEYSRLLAVRLLSRAAIENRPFKLGIEFKAADKFDDLAFYNESAKEWWLIQAKHSLDAKEITREALFSGEASNGDVDMIKYFKSYLRIKQNWRHGEEKVKLFLFTNKPLSGSISSKNVEVDEMLVFSEGNHVQLVPAVEDLQTIVKYVNNELCDALVKLFEQKHGREIIVLKYHARLVSRVLVKDGSKLKFSESFLSSNSENEFYAMLKSAFAKKTNDLSTLSVAVPSRFPDFWSDSVENSELPFIDDDSVKAYFSELILSVSQPNVKRLEEAIKSDWNRWMKSWIRPDVFRRLTRYQLNEAFNTFKGYFSEWEKPHEKLTTRRFLSYTDSSKWLEAVKRKLKDYVKQYGRQGCAGLDAAEKYYVNRRITFGKRKESTKNVNDGEFVQWLDDDWTNPQCIALFAEPGMGKSTLWQQLAFRSQQNHKDVEVYLIFLNDLKADAQPVDESMSVKSATSILEAVISAEHVTPLLDKNQKVIFFLDAFDELTENNMKSILNLVKVFERNESKVKFLISSRERCRRQLVNSLQVRVIDVVPLDKANRRDFLRSFWNAEDDRKFDAYSEVLLKKFERDAPRADIEFIGLPLTMKMLAELFQGSFEEYLDSTNIAEPESLLPNVSINVIYLYEQFVTKCILLSLNRKWNLKLTDGTVAQIFDPQIASATKNYQLLAMELMKLNHLIEDTHQAQVKNFRDEIKKGLEESLLLETVDERPQFSHLSYAEFFCASYLLEKLSHSGKISSDLQKELSLGSGVVRWFFFKILNAKLSSTGPEPTHVIYEVVKVPESDPDNAVTWACEYDCAHFLSHLLNARTIPNFLLDRINTIIDRQDTLLHIAARSNSCDAMKVLLHEAGTKIDVENYCGKTALYVACEEGHLDMVKLLVDEGANVGHVGFLMSPLSVAFSRGQMDIIECLLSDAAKIHPKYYESVGTALLYAAKDERLFEKNYLDIVKMLITKGANLNYCDRHQRTALHLASTHNNKKIATVLLDSGANIDAQDKNGQTPLHLAAQKYALDVAQLLLERGATVNIANTKPQPVLHFAAFLGLSSVVEEQLNSGADVNERDGSHWNNTVLHAAAAGGQLDVVRLLIARGADVNALNRWNRTALHFAASAGNAAVVEELCKCSVNVNARESSSDTPLHFAAKKGHLDVVLVLITRGADINLTGYMGFTALDRAVHYGRTAVVDELLKRTADITKTDSFIRHATARGHSDTVTLLEAHRDKRQSSSDSR